MAKLLFTGALILLLPGCGGEPAAAKVAFVETRVDESQSPLPFVIAVANSGDAATDATGVKIEVVDGFELPAAGEAKAAGEWNAIASADCRIEMLAGHPTIIPAHGEGVACGFVRWDRPAGAPPAIGVFSARFLTTLADGQTLTTPLRVFVLSSEPGGVESLIDGLSADRAQAVATLKRIESLEGARTPAVDRLLDRLRTLSK